MWELQIKFYWGQNEDYSSGDSISDSSKQLLQSARKKGKYICDFGEEGIYAFKHIIFHWKFLLVKRSSRHHEGISCFSRYEEIQELGLIKSSPENICLKTCPASFPRIECLVSALHPELLRACWRPAAVAAQDLTLIEADGKNPRQEPICVDNVFSHCHFDLHLLNYQWCSIDLFIGPM